MSAGQPTRSQRTSLWPLRLPATVKRHRATTRPNLANRLDAYLDLMSALEPTEIVASRPPRHLGAGRQEASSWLIVTRPCTAAEPRLWRGRVYFGGSKVRIRCRGISASVTGYLGSPSTVAGGSGGSGGT